MAVLRLNPDGAAAVASKERRALQGLLRINHVATRTSDLDALCSHVLDVLDDVLGPSRSSVLLVERDRVMRFRGWRRLSDAYRAAVEGHTPWKLDDPAPEPITVDDVKTAPDLAQYRALFEQEGIAALAFVPLVSAGRLLGKFMLYYDAPHAFDREEIEVAQAIAAHIAFVVARVKAESDLALYRVIFENSTEPTAIIDSRGVYVEQNAAHRALLGYSDQEVAGQTPALHLGDEGFAKVSEAITRDGRCALDVRSRTRDGVTLDVELRAFAIRDAAGHPTLFVGTKRDVSALRRSERRLRLLAEGGQILSTCPDPDQMLAQIARAAANTLADFCVVDVITDGTPRRIAAAAADPRKQEALEALRQYAPVHASTQPSAEAMRSKRPFVVTAVDDAVLRQTSRDERQYQLLRQLAPHSTMAIPLLGRDRVLGALTFSWAESGRSYDDGDLECALELCQRVAIALDNVRLHAELNEAVRARDEFLSIASHELKTPLTSLQLQLERMLRTPEAVPEPAANAVAAAARQTRRLGKLVNELLEVSRISAGQLKLECDRVDLGAMVREVVQRFEPELTRSGCTVTVETEGDLVGTWDGLRLDLAISNLLSNACKYGPGKPALVRVRRLGETVRLEVQDHGIGIAPEHLSRVFGRFERMVSARHFGGFGLGLWITRSIVEAHGGTISAQSALGQGSTFVVDLPVTAS